MKANIKKILNQSIKLLSTGIVGGAGAGIVIAINNKNDEHFPKEFETNYNIEPKTDLSTLSCTLTEEFNNIPTDETLITTFAGQKNLTYTNDLRVERESEDAKTIKIVTVPNSYYYEESTYATVTWKPITSKDWTSLYGSALVSHLAVFEDTEVGRNELLADLAANYQNLDVSQLYIDTNELDHTSKSANIRVVEGSVIYDSAIRGTVTAGFVQASEITVNYPTVNSTGYPATPTFKFKGTTISGSSTALTYTISPSVATPVSFESSRGSTYGRVAISTTNANFAGAMYTITGTYKDPATNNSYVSRTQVYVPKMIYDTGWINYTTSYYYSSNFTIDTNARGAFRKVYNLVTVVARFSSKVNPIGVGLLWFDTGYRPTASQNFNLGGQTGGQSYTNHGILSTDGTMTAYGTAGIFFCDFCFYID